MSTTQTGFSQKITDEVTSWPGVEARYGSRGEWGFNLRGRQLGHLHGDHSAHLFFPSETWRRLHDEGRIKPHPVFPDRQGPAARAVRTEADAEDVIAMLRMNYERAVARFDSSDVDSDSNGEG